MIRLRSYITALLMALLAASCSKDVASWEGPVIELRLSCDDSAQGTRVGFDGVDDGEDRYNENLISWVDFFFYPDGETSEQAKYHVRKESGKRRSDVFRLELSQNDVNYQIFPVAFDVRDATVFAVANAPEEMIAGLTDTSLDNIKSQVVSTDFLAPFRHRQEQFIMTGEQIIQLDNRNQAVVARGTVNLERLACKITVGLNVLDKVEIGKEVWTPLLSGMEIYLVDAVSNATLGGGPAGKDGGVAVPNYFSYRSNSDKFFDNEGDPYMEKDGDYYLSWPMYTYPQYWEYGSEESPNKEPYLKLVLPWTRAKDEANGIESTERQYYYRVMIPDDNRGEGFRQHFLRNNWYHFNIDVGILGAETDDAAVRLGASCYFVYWQDKDVVVKHAEIGNARYLSVNQDSYEMHNLDELNVGFTSSHTIAITDITVERPYYGTKKASTDPNNPTVDLGANVIEKDGVLYLHYTEEQRKAIRNEDGKDWFEDVGGAVAITHALNNDYSSTYFDYSPYTMTFTICHADRPTDERYRKTVTVVQYPGVFIQANLNSEPRQRPPGTNIDDDVQNNRESYRNFPYNGYVFVNGVQLKRRVRSDDGTVTCIYGQTALELGVVDSWDDNNPDKNKSVRDVPQLRDLQWRIINFTGGNKNIYNITVTVLPSDNKFVLGDPRSTTVNNNPGGPLDPEYSPYHTPFCDAEDLNGTTRTLSYYYPAENSDRTANMLAPSFRVASKFGGTEYFDGIRKEDALNRCATYQEDGYPAGRWRLPTKAEINFISRLSSNGIFTVLFSTSSKYWSANGAVSPGKDAIQNTEYALVRCVYDSWYWDLKEDRIGEGNDSEGVPLRAHFVWGDMER